MIFRSFGNSLAGLDPNADLKFNVELASQIGQRIAHLKGGAHGPERVILMHDGNAEDTDDRVADELLNDATMPLDRGAHRLVVTIENASQHFGVKALAEFCRRDEVAEERRHRSSIGGGIG